LIAHISNPSEIVQLTAVTGNKKAIKYIEYPTEAVRKFVGFKKTTK
jgi:hypothetical protein